jgi:hypothetical protein
MNKQSTKEEILESLRIVNMKINFINRKKWNKILN